jgi:hypothetical protein
MILHRNRGGTITEPTMIFSFNFDVQKFNNSKNCTHSIDFKSFGNQTAQKSLRAA